MFEVSRRDLIIGAAGASAAFGLDRPLAFIGAAQAQTTPAGPGFKSYKVGDIEVISLYDGVWEKAHDENFIKGANVEQTKAALKAGGLTDAFVPIPFTIMAVKTPSGVVLIDTGTGGQTGGPKAGLAMQSMAAAGIEPKVGQDDRHLAFPWRPHLRPEAKGRHRAGLPGRRDHRAGG